MGLSPENPLYARDRPVEPRPVKLKAAVMFLVEQWRRPFGLRRGRLLVFWRMLRHDGLRRRDVVAIFRVLKGAALEFRHGRPPGRTRERILADYRVCVRCVLHVNEFHQCDLCKCGMAYKLAAGGGCAAREADPHTTIGFSFPAAPENSSSPLPSRDPIPTPGAEPNPSSISTQGAA